MHPTHKREHTTYRHRHSDISIFNKVEVTVEPQPSPKLEVTQNATNDDKTDSVADCFKAMFSCCKK
jgi:hypothetical protein